MGIITKINAGGTDHLIASSAYGTCTTAANTAAKVVTLSNFDLTPIAGMTIHVRFTNSNTAASPTLNVNSKGAKSIYAYGTTAPGTTVGTSWQAGAVVSFTYNTDNNSSGCWVMNNYIADTNTTYTVPTITLNGSSTTSPSFYAPTGAGTSGQYLESNGSGAPSWTNFPTIPDVSGKIDTAGTGLSKSGTTLNHSNSVTAQTTQAVYPIKIDAQGHVSAYGSAVTIPTVPSNIVNTITTSAGAHATKSNATGTVNFNVPTKTSHLTNDSGFATTDAIFNSLIDFFYPVGSYYETSDVDFDPNSAWGGTWVLEAAGQVHVSAGTGYTVTGALTNTTDGGSKDAIVPYHNHGFTDPQYQATGGSVADHASGAGTCNRSTSVSVSVSAHGITQPAFKLTQTAANVQHSGEYVSVDEAVSWHQGTLNTNTSATYKYLRSTVSPAASVSRSTPTVPEKACTRTTDVALTNNHSVSVTQPVFTTPKLTHSFTQPTISLKSGGGGSVSYAGTSGNLTNANMQPYIIVNRWHRTA